MRSLLAVFLLCPAVAQAESYCQISSGQYAFGHPTAAVKMKVVVDSVKRPSTIPGQTPSLWCNIAFYGGSFYKPVEVVKRPALGKVAHGHYSIRYAGSKPGADQFVVKVFQMDRYNKPFELTATVDVEVVSAPF